MVPIALSTRRHALTLIVATGAVALAVLIAVSMGSLAPAPMPGVDGGLLWHPSARDATALQSAAVSELLGWLRVAGWSALAVGVVSVLALFGHLAGAVGAELVIHRAVGASRRALVGRSLMGGLGLAVVTIAVGTVAGLIAAGGAFGSWPGPAPSWHWGATVPLVLLSMAVVAGSLFPLTGLRTRRLAEPPAAVPPLTIPALQLGLALAITVAGAMVVRRVGDTIAAGPDGRLAGGWLVTVSSNEPGLDRRAASYDSLLRQFGADGTTLASLTNAGGHLGLGTVDRLVTDCGQCYVGGIFLKWRDLDAGYHTVSADTFDAKGFKVVEGRAFKATDRIGSRPVAVVNVHLARRYFEEGRAIGRDVFLGGRLGGTPYRVIGVVDDGLPAGLGAGQGPLEQIYLSSLQHPSRTMEIWVGGTSEPSGAIPYRAYLERQRAVVRWFGRWFAIEGAMALLLGAIGTGALLWLWVRALRPELGIRRAVGAPRWRVVAEVLGPAAKTGLGGAVAGVIFFGPVLWPEMSRIVTGIPWWQPGLIVSIAGVLVAVAVGAALIPAVAASRARCVDLWADQ